MSLIEKGDCYHHQVSACGQATANNIWFLYYKKISLHSVKG